MKRITKRRQAKIDKRRYCGYSHDDIMEFMLALCELEDDIIITDKQQEAMDLAIQALCSINNALVGSGKVVLNG